MAAPIIDACLKVLETASATQKVAAAHHAVSLLQSPHTLEPLTPAPILPARPARPEKPPLVAPPEVPKRRLGSIEGRAALLHAIAHIEFNAIDMAFDMAARFAATVAERGLDADLFVRQWVGVGGEEALHFSMVTQRMQALGVNYGDLPAHDGLWQAAQDTADSLIARLAIAPMVLEARGLDVTPAMITRLNHNNDPQSAAILQQIYEDEIGHVATGVRWFRKLCVQDRRDPATTFQHLVNTRFHGQPKEPFNHQARQRAGIDIAFYRTWMADFTS